MVNIDYLYNPDAVKETFDKNYFIDKKLGFQVIEHGLILSHKRQGEGDWWGFGGIVDGKGEFVKSSCLRNGYCKVYTPPNQFNTAPKRSFISECSLMLGDTPLPTIFVGFGF